MGCLQPAALLRRSRTSTIPNSVIQLISKPANIPFLPLVIRAPQKRNLFSKVIKRNRSHSRYSFVNHHADKSHMSTIKRKSSAQLSSTRAPVLADSATTHEESPEREAELLRSKASDYGEHFQELIEAEMEEGEEVVRMRLSQWTLDKLKEHGYTLTNLHAYKKQPPSDVPSYSDYIVCFTLAPGHMLPFNLFTPGNSVTIVPSGKSPVESQVPIAFGTVIHSSATEIRVTISKNGRLFKNPKKMWRLDLRSSQVGYLRTKGALNMLRSDPTLECTNTYILPELLRLWEPMIDQPPTEDNRMVVPNESEATTPLSPGDSYRHRPGLFISNPEIADWMRRRSLPIYEQKEGDPDLKLDATQIKAVILMLRESISLIQGPPGTGKTRTIIEAVRVLKAHFKVTHPLLVCTYTNAAVDNLVSGLAGAGMKPLRVGGLTKVSAESQEWTLPAQIVRHPEYKELARLMEDSHEVTRKLSKSQPDIPKAELKKRSKSLKSDIHNLHRKIISNVFDEADVICTTCLTAGSDLFKDRNFPLVFLDEASMSTEPASIIPIMHRCQHLSLIGDHQQLPPVVTSSKARDKGFAKSLFERLIESPDIPRIMLNQQYRMHPSISEFSRVQFYEGALEDGTVLPTGAVGPSFLPPHSRHLTACKSNSTGQIPSVLFIHHDRPESTMGRSRANRGEMTIIAAIVEDLLLRNPDMMGKDIGIIAPYIAQINILSNMLGNAPEWTEYFAQILGEERALQIRDIEVKTVDGFEGREKEVIIFSTVRNNWFGNIGFLADRRRMNVALTRARRGLFVVGNITTLSKKVDDSFTDTEPIEEMKNGVGKLMIHKGDEWKKYVEFVVAQNMLFTDYHHPNNYRSSEEDQEFEIVAGLGL